jgi:hypothetical protein
MKTRVSHGADPATPVRLRKEVSSAAGADLTRSGRAR